MFEPRYLGCYDLLRKTVAKQTSVQKTLLRPTPCILTINGGSSSIKFALYRADSPTTRILSGKIERIGLPNPKLTIKDSGQNIQTQSIRAPNHRAAGQFLIRWLARHAGNIGVAGIGH